MIYNVYGKKITGTRELEDPSFGELGIDGEYHPYWTEENALVDERGFDKTHLEPNGKYKMDVELPKGTRLIRYGAPTGWLTAPLGTPYKMLGLPWKVETVEYHEYEVISDGISVKTIVTRGLIAPMFSSEGGGIQYLHPVPIDEEILSHRLREVFSWR